MNKMKKLYFKTTGQEPDVNFVDKCPYIDYRPREGTMIGSASCQQCKACYGWDSEENWIKCLAHALEANED